MELKPVLILDADEPASRAVSEIAQTGLGVVITKEGKYFGLIDDREIRKKLHDISKTKCANICKPAPYIGPNYEIKRICELFFAGKWKAIPVIEKGKILGLLTRSEVTRMLLREGTLSGYKVEDVMSSPVVSIEADATLANAKGMMRKYNVRRLVVTKKGYIEGILTTFDITRHVLILAGEKKPLFGDKENPDIYPVSSYMRKKVFLLPPSAPLSEAARMMVENEISSVVVADGGKAIGVITSKDIFETAMRREGGTTKKIFVLGLEEEDRILINEIMEDCRKVVERIEKFAPVEFLSIHIKKAKKMYSVRGRLISRVLFLAHSNDWNLKTAVSEVMRQLQKQIEKRRTQIIDRKS